MSNLYLPPDSESKEEEPEEINYNATDEDEEKFFLMYHMHMQPSEVESLNTDYRKWLIARFVGQKVLKRKSWSVEL